MLKHPAEFTVHTPTGPVHSCVKHARQIEGLMRMLGAPTRTQSKLLMARSARTATMQRRRERHHDRHQDQQVDMGA